MRISSEWFGDLNSGVPAYYIHTQCIEWVKSTMGGFDLFTPYSLPSSAIPEPSAQTRRRCSAISSNASTKTWPAHATYSHILRALDKCIASCHSVSTFNYIHPFEGVLSHSIQMQREPIFAGPFTQICNRELFSLNIFYIHAMFVRFL